MVAGKSSSPGTSSFVIAPWKVTFPAWIRQIEIVFRAFWAT